MLFKRPMPNAPLPLEQVHAIGEDVGILVKISPPDAIYVVVLVQEHLAVHGTELFRSIYIEDENTPRVQGLVHPPNGTAAVLGARDIIQTVQSAHCQIHPPGQIQPGQILVEEYRPGLRSLELLLGLGEHILGQVHPDYRQPSLGQQRRHRTCAAGQVGSRAGRNPLPAHNLKIKIHCILVMDIAGQAVVAGSQGFVRIHRQPSK